jgi:hypothetical protein
MTLSEKIAKWKEHGEDYEEGLRIYLHYGRPNVNVKRMLSRVDMITHRHRERLRYELNEAVRYAPTRSALPPPINPPTIPEMVKKPPRQKKGTVIPDAAPTTVLDGLYAQLKTLYTRRALLSNKLRIDHGDPAIIAANIKILDELAPIMEEMKGLEARIRAERMGDEPERMISQSEMLIIRRRNESYTLVQLEGMSAYELKRLKKRVQDDLKKARDTYERKNLKTEATRVRAGRTMKLKEGEISALEKIILRVEANELQRVP